ncbi:uncharacterized protein LOC121602103 [Anopheles merus]|uniref:uncharacterized protein LOC121602103 n=1 Tax=Anopheles merus TaxID=30066 RepID=UPI001BE4DFFC|nr:uncharacterized protein LOC121602103 [Anopheles merus]
MLAEESQLHNDQTVAEVNDETVREKRGLKYQYHYKEKSFGGGLLPFKHTDETRGTLFACGSSVCVVIGEDQLGAIVHEEGNVERERRSPFLSFPGADSVLEFDTMILATVVYQGLSFNDMKDTTEAEFPMRMSTSPTNITAQNDEFR